MVVKLPSVFNSVDKLNQTFVSTPPLMASTTVSIVQKVIPYEPLRDKQKHCTFHVSFTHQFSYMYGLSHKYEPGLSAVRQNRECLWLVMLSLHTD